MKVLLCIVDGFGISDNSHFTIPFIQKNLHKGCLIEASGKAVGLVDGQMGNSEVGHMTIGSGRIIKQNLTQITDAISDGSFPVVPSADTYHLVGLLSDGGVHSHIDHLIYLIESLKGKRIFLHLIADGRDTPPKSFKIYLEKIKTLLDDHCRIATITGRYYAMDRDKSLDRTEIAYDAIALGKSSKRFTSPDQLVDDYYSCSITDEFFLPSVDSSYNGFSDSDAIIFFNFRSDRMRQIVDFVHTRNQSNQIISMVDYFDSQRDRIINIFQNHPVNQTLGEVISSASRKQLRIAETEKYAHVTFFLNCGAEQAFTNEDRILIPSPKVATYDLQPEMSAYEITDKLKEIIPQKTYDFIVVNFANADMVGHTGNPAAAKIACEVLDICLSEISDKLIENDYVFLITADHGNIEQIHDHKTNQPHTAHTLNKVPFICINKDISLNIDIDYKGGLRDVAPTVLKLMNINIPHDMTGKPLFSLDLLSG